MRAIIPLLLASCTLLLMMTACQSTGGGRSQYGEGPGPQGFRTVVLDAGHGGRDSGARARGLQEKHLALDIAKRVGAELRPGFKVVMTRDSDRFIDLDDRVRQANKYGDAVLLSIHLNHGPRRLSGPETYYWRTDSYALARRVHRNLIQVSSNESGNRGMVRRRLRLTRNPRIPSLLLECGYLTSPRESALLNTPAYRARLARAIADGIRETSASGDAGVGPLPPPIYMPPSKASDRRDSR